jgi:capsular polysaccharide transport system permease protein
VSARMTEHTGLAVGQTWRALGANVRVINALILREIVVSFRISRAGYFLALAEPIMQFAMMYVIFSAISRHPGYGQSLGLFLATGIIPYFMFLHLSSRVMHAIRGYRSFARVSTVTPLDLAAARGLLEFLTLLIFAAAVMLLLSMRGEAGWPARPERLAQVVMLIGLTAFGVGLANGVLSDMFRTYGLVYSIFARSALFFSAVFYVPSFLPEQARYYLWFNPVLHAVEWFRTGIYPTYPTLVLSEVYLMGWAIASITIGMLLVGTARSRLSR